MPFNNVVAAIGFDFTMFRFTSGFEALFVTLMLVPLAFCACCVVYLLYLLFSAILLRRKVAILQRPDAGADGTAGLGTGRQSAMVPMAAAPGTKHRFVVLIPAHNEELLLGAVLDSLHGLDYPSSHYRLVVIADNCTDRTAAIAREHGAVTLERFDTELIGKGYALEWALNQLLNVAPTATMPSELSNAAPFDAVVILDADTVASPNLLLAFDTALTAGHVAAQVRYDVMNADESWRTRLMGCALALAHLVKPLGRERLKLSDGLKGNGMCFARKVVEQVPWSGESITEDIEYTLRLCRAGYRIAFLPEATVWAQMPTTGAQATSQRKRWEGGRYRLLLTVGPKLLTESLRSRNRLLRDRAYELIIPPFAELFALPILCLFCCLLASDLFAWPWAHVLTNLWILLLAGQALYLLGGMWVARTPISVAFSLLYAPIYIVWKFGVYVLMVASRSSGGWKRTERHEL